MAEIRPESPTRKPSSKLRIDWWLVAALAIPVLFFLPEVLGFNVFAGIDTSRLNMPLRYFDRLAFNEGAIPLWNPYLYAGFPAFAESESGVFYPGSIFTHLPGDFFHWYSISIVFHLMVAATGFYVWMRRRGHSRPTSAFLAATYCTTPFLIFHITAFGLFTSIAWLPWYLVIFEAGINGKRPVRTGLWLALFLAVMLMSGSSHAAYLGAMALACYAVGIIIAQPDSKARKRAVVRVLAVLLPTLLCPVIAAIQILPTSELAYLSERSGLTGFDYYKLGTWLTIPRLASLVLFPALGNPDDLQDYGSSLCFLGVIPLILVASTVARYREIGRSIFPLLFGAAITLILAFGMNLPGYTLIVQIPPFSLFRYAGRSAHVAFTFLLPLAGPAIDMIWTGGGKQFFAVTNRWIVGFIAGMVIVIVALTGGAMSGGMVKVGAGFSAVAFFTSLGLGIAILQSCKSGSAQGTRRGWLVASLIVSLLLQIFALYPFSRLLVQRRDRFDQSLAFFDDVKAGFPLNIEIPRIVMAGGHLLMAPDALAHLDLEAQESVYDNMAGDAPGLKEVTAVEGLTPLVQTDWKFVLRDTLQVRMEDAASSARENDEPVVPDDLSIQILRLLGSDVILLDGSDWEIPGYAFWRDDLSLPYHAGLAAYRAENGWVPDAYFVRNVDFAGKLEFADFLRWLGRDGRDLNEQAIAEIGDGDSPQALSMGQILGRERGMNRLGFDVEVAGPEPSLLIIGENFYPGWKAYIDGKEVDYLRTNFLFGGVIVPEGSHRVELFYRPKSFHDGMKLTFVGLAVWLILVGLVSFVHARRKESFITPIEESARIGMEG